MADRKTMLKEIGEVSFMINDLTLYLDTHPTDRDAMECFSEAAKKRKQLMKEYADQYEPLTMDCVCPDANNRSASFTKYPDQKHFTWTDGPLPWEGGIL
ncbi:MAG: spore coat protein CotJB [Lachnospiraceae bacterium]|nr:spore coat protein CotJB [Lachnospiraceae bacterium]